MRHTTREPSPSSGDGPPSKRTLLLALTTSARGRRGRATSTPPRAARRLRARGRRTPGSSRARGPAASAASRHGETARSRRRRIRRHARVALGPDVARGPPGRHGDAVALFLREAQHHLHRVLELLHRADHEEAAPDHVVEQLLAPLGAQDGDGPVHGRHAAARDVGQLAGKVAAVVALGAGVLLRAVEVHLHQLAVRLVDHHLALDVELLHLRERDTHLALDLLHHEALVGEHLGAEEADGEAHDVAEALQVLRLPLDVLGLLAPVVQPRGVGDLDLARRRDLAGHADEADLREPLLLRVGQGQVVRAVGVPGAGARDRLGHGGDHLGPGRGGHVLVGGRDDGAVEEALAQPVAEDGGHHAAVLAAREDLRILAARGDHAPVAAEEPLVHAGLHREHLVPQIELAQPEARAHLRTHVAADALADTAVVEGSRGLGHLLRLPVHVVDDVVRADQHAGAALAAASVGDDLIHHLLEARMLDHRADTIRRRFAVSIAGRKPYYHAPMLSDAELRVLRAVAEALIPPGGPFPLGAGDVGTAERLARYLQGMAPETERQVRLLLRAWEAAPLASRHLRRFSRLAPAAREEWGERCLASRLPWRRIPLLLLQPLCLSAFCADPRVEAALGYGHECLDGRAPGAGPRLVPLQYPDVRGDVEEVADVCVVGSGAGGAVVAYELARAGLRVGVLEEGGYFTQADFTGPPMERVQRFYRNGGATVALGRPTIPVPLGECLGGTMVVSSGP